MAPLGRAYDGSTSMPSSHPHSQFGQQQQQRGTLPKANAAPTSQHTATLSSATAKDTFGAPESAKRNLGVFHSLFLFPFDSTWTMRDEDVSDILAVRTAGPKRRNLPPVDGVISAISAPPAPLPTAFSALQPQHLHPSHQLMVLSPESDEPSSSAPHSLSPSPTPESAAPLKAYTADVGRTFLFFVRRILATRFQMDIVGMDSVRCAEQQREDALIEDLCQTVLLEEFVSFNQYNKLPTPEIVRAKLERHGRLQRKAKATVDTIVAVKRHCRQQQQPVATVTSPTRVQAVTVDSEASYSTPLPSPIPSPESNRKFRSMEDLSKNRQRRVYGGANANSFR